VRATKAIKERYRESEALLVRQRDEAKRTIEQLGLDVRQVGTVNAARKALAAKEEQIAALNQRREREIGLVHETLRLREENTKRTERGTKATRSHAAAVSDEADAIDESLLMFQELAQRVNDYTTGMEELSSISQYFLSDEERLTVEYAKQRDEIQALTTELEALATTEEMRQEAAIQGSIALAAAEKKYSDEVQKLRDEAAEEQAKADADEEARIKDLLDKARAEAEERDALRRQQMQAAAEAMGQIVSTVTDGIERSADEAASTLASMEGELAANRDEMTEAERQALKERIETQRQQARKQFEIAKLGRLAEATIATAASVANALATPPAPNLLLAGLAGATGAAQLAAIASVQPAFHSGGMVPDETQARLLTGEAVLSRTGRNMIGDDQINRANAGMSQPVQVVAVQQYRHRVYNDFVRDNLRLGGSLADAIRGSRTVGMREAV
jgi:myosin heavy subunit